MSVSKSHFGLKLIAMTLVITMFATLFPSRLVSRAFAESDHDSINFSNSDSSLFDYLDNKTLETNPKETECIDLLDGYGQVALEKLGKTTTVENITPYKRSDVSYEIQDISNAFSRNYALKDGNYSRIIFGGPVNYRTSEGFWRRINLALQKEDWCFQTKDTPYSLKFSASAADDANLLELTFDAISLAMSPVYVSSETTEAVYIRTPHSENELLSENPCESGKIIYSGIFAKREMSPSASLEYNLEPYKIKENIIVSEGGFAQYYYDFKLITDAHSFKLEDSSIQLHNEYDETIFRVSAEKMTDAKGATSDNVQLMFEQDETGFIIRVSADAEWINNPEREFPIAIDPTIEIVDPNSSDVYEAAYVRGSTREYGLAAGTGTVSFIKINDNLFTGFPQGAAITAANASFSGGAYPAYYSGEVAFRTDTIVTPWTAEAIYNGYIPPVPPSYMALLDSNRQSFSYTGFVYVSFTADITSNIRSLVNGNSNGFAITTDVLNGQFPNHVQLSLDSVEITYSDNSGLNSYQSKHSVSIDGSGTAYIKDINGDLFFVHPGITTKGEILPVSIDFVFSSAFKGTATDSYYGSGWRLSIIQTMMSETVTDINGDTYTNYVFTDGTGGKHYFTHTSGYTFTAEENPFWKYNSNTRLMEYGDGSTAEFNLTGYLVEYTDAFNNYYHITYDGTTSKITGVTDGNGVDITFIYGQNYLAGMFNLSCISRSVALSYTDANLTKISTPVGESTSFVYNSNGTMSRFGYRKTSSEILDRQYVIFSYSASAVNGVYSVSNVFKWGLGNGSSYSLREIAYITYSGFTEYGHRYGVLSQDALYTEYIYFDRSGRTTAVFDSLGNVSGSNYEGGQLGKMNLLSGKTASVMTDANLVKDFSEKTSEWTKYIVSGSGDFFSVSSNSPFPMGKYGSDCFNLKSNSQTTEIYAKYPVSEATPGKTYTLSSEIDPESLIGTGGIVLGIMFDTSGSTGIKLLSTPMHYDVAVCAQYTFEIPSNAIPGSVNILIGVKNLQGSLYFDLVSLTEGADSRQTNLLSNSGYYYGTQGWSQTGTFTANIGTNDRVRYVTIPGSINEERSLSQTLPTSIFDGGYLVISGYGKGKAVSSGKFGITIHFSNICYDDVELLFSNAINEWQYVSVIIPVTDYSSYVTISLVNDYNYTGVCFGGVVVEYVAGLGDYTDRSQYIHDGFGRIVYEKSFSGGEKLYSYVDNYSESVEQTICSDKKGNITTVDYTYNNTQNPFAITQICEIIHPNISGADDIITVKSYVYNTHGSLIESAVYTAGTQTSHSLYSYTSDGRFLEKSTDIAGRFTTFSYQSSTGDLLSVVNGDGTTVSYTYDSYGRLTSESEGGTSLELSYNQNSTVVSHNGYAYSIDTDNDGNRTSFTILDINGNTNRTMATYTHGGALGQISKLSYGNNQNKYFGYDSLGNLTFVSYTQGANQDTATFAWYYDSNGNTVKYVDRSDSSNPVTKEYSYNPEGKLKYIISSDGNSVLYHYSTSTNTDYEIFTSASSGNVYNYYTMSDDAEKTITKSGAFGTKTITYDSLGRVLSSTNGSISKTYEYKCFIENVLFNSQQISLKNESALVAEESCSISAIPTISYTYYDNGKISAIFEDNDQVAKYEYDVLGRLVREDNKKLNGGIGYTIKYTYDSGSNMTSKATFSYSPNVATANLFGNASLIGLAIYGYDSVFRDLLISYYGQSSYYSYDSIGNPLTYFGSKSYTMTWTQGNKLATVKPYGSTYDQSYLYDADGLRTEKTLVSNANVTTRISYFWVGNTLKSEWAEDGSYEIIYDYDAIGRICGFAYSQNGSNDTYYKYIRNAQGDVTHIVNNSGTVIAAYTYDTWGKLISIKDGSGIDITTDTTSIGYINPIRYRGYYYDNETGFYYLHSRYYDPSTGRFINADNQLNIGEGSLGCNLFIYCCNDPVNYADPNGDIAITTIILIGSIVIGVVAAGVTTYKCVENGCSVAETIINAAVSGVSAFATVYTYGMSLYGLYLSYCECHGITPKTDISLGASKNEIDINAYDAQVRDCADRACKKIQGYGHVAGTQKHTALKAEIDALKDPRLRAEVSFLNGEEIDYGKKGSVRLDVALFDDGGNIICAWDLKTGSARLTTERIKDIIEISGKGFFEIFEIRG